MPSFILCGPKMAVCMLVLSMWGVIMLAMLGIFFSVHSAVLIEDVPLKEEDHQDSQNPLQNVYAVYNQVGYNCFIAAGIYVVIGLVSFVQVRLNKRNDYLVR
ncbi:ribonuclease kappa-A [Ictalurus punctatus]|uniref:Ribonuclease kappa-A n=1 Tax=Ictalurus punctatus TaxID=7998 RepID=A0A2D0RBV1_ICTPU|nr:ribonuclease kappa-A [Ictalurus punctatus]XP_053485061.1 ribonuclease kappa-A [Ictalurus furcatus]